MTVFFFFAFQEAGVGVGWYLDLCATLTTSWAQLSKVFDGLGGGGCFQFCDCYASKKPEQPLNAGESKLSDQTALIQALDAEHGTKV